MRAICAKNFFPKLNPIKHLTFIENKIIGAFHGC